MHVDVKANLKLYRMYNSITINIRLSKLHQSMIFSEIFRQDIYFGGSYEVDKPLKDGQLLSVLPMLECATHMW